MQYGLFTFATDYAMQPAALARAAEERGFESLWLAEHTHIPCSRESPWPGGTELPKMYYDAYAPLVALAAAATTGPRSAAAAGAAMPAARITHPRRTRSIKSLRSSGRFRYRGWSAAWGPRCAWLPATISSGAGGRPTPLAAAVGARRASR